ncbi:MAG: YgiT-type zinc finger protein [bacterium]|nr:YgiT-type zinc finger protein [bacterium]
MKCGACNYPKVEQVTTTMDKWQGNQLIAIKCVPVERCPQCVEEYFSPEVLRALERLIDAPHEPVDQIAVPIFKYQPLVA